MNNNLIQGKKKDYAICVMHQSIQPVPIPTGNLGAFVQVLCPGVGHLRTPGRPSRELIHVVSKPTKARAVKLRVLLFGDGGFRAKGYGFCVTVACPRRTRQAFLDF